MYLLKPFYEFYFFQVLLLKYLIDYICDEDDEKYHQMKEFKTDFLNPNSVVRLFLNIENAIFQYAGIMLIFLK